MQIYHIPKTLILASKVQRSTVVVFSIKSKETYSKYVCEVLSLNKMLHCGQFVEYKYSIVDCISVYSNEVFSNVEKRYFTFSWHNFAVGRPFYAFFAKKLYHYIAISLKQ